MGKSKSAVTGKWYLLAFHDLLGLQADALLELQIEDQTAWQGEVTDNATINVDALNVLGGEQDQGGVQGPMSVMFGAADQLPNAYLSSVFGTRTAAWRGFTTIAWEGGKWGANSPYAHKQSYKPRFGIRMWEGGCWYEPKAMVPIGTTTGTTEASQLPWKYLVLSKSDTTDYSGPSFDDSGWATGSAPFASRAASGGYNPSAYGFSNTPATVVPVGKRVWTRCDVYCTADQTSITFKAWVDNNAKLYVNGELVATVGGYYGGYYTATLPAGTFHAGVNHIALDSWDNEGEGTDSQWFWSDWRFEGLQTVSATAFAMNPVHILYYLQTQPGRGAEPTANMADANLKAAADWYYAQGFGLCGTRKAASVSPADYIRQIEKVAGCAFVRSPVDGKFYVNIANGEYDLESLPILTDDDVLAFKETPTVLNEAINSVSVKYFDPAKKLTVTTAPVRALALIAAFGERRQTLDYPEIPTAELANRVALRELLGFITPVRKFELDTKPTTNSYLRGQYFRLQLPKRGIADMVCEVGEIEYGKLVSGGNRLTAVQDTIKMPDAAYVGIEHGVDTRPSQTPLPVVNQRLMEAPYLEICQQLPRAELDALPPETGYLFAVATDPGESRDFTMMVAPDGGEYASNGYGDFCPTATLVAAIGYTDTGPFSLTNAKALASVQVGDPALLEDELCRVDAIDATANTITLGRACADTVPAKHAAGARLYFYADHRAYSTTEYTDGELVHAKLLTNTPSQQLPIAGATALDLTFDQRQFRPYPPAGVTINAASFPASVTGDAVISAAARNRVTQADQLVDWTMATIAAEAGTTYSVRNVDVETDTQTHLATGITAWPHTIPAADLRTLNRVEVWSVRDGVESWQRVQIPFTTGTALLAETGDAITTEDGDAILME